MVKIRTTNGISPSLRELQSRRSARETTSVKRTRKRKRALEEPTVDGPQMEMNSNPKRRSRRSKPNGRLIDCEKPVGKVKKDDNGQLLWCTKGPLGSENEDDWVPAVYHNDRRQYLLARADLSHWQSTSDCDHRVFMICTSPSYS